MPQLLHAALSQTLEMRFTSYAGLELGSHGNTRMLLQTSEQHIALGDLRCSAACKLDDGNRLDAHAFPA